MLGGFYAALGCIFAVALFPGYAGALVATAAVFIQMAATASASIVTFHERAETFYADAPFGPPSHVMRELMVLTDIDAGPVQRLHAALASPRGKSIMQWCGLVSGIAAIWLVLV